MRVSAAGGSAGAAAAAPASEPLAQIRHVVHSAGRLTLQGELSVLDDVETNRPAGEDVIEGIRNWIHAVLDTGVQLVLRGKLVGDGTTFSVRLGLVVFGLGVELAPDGPLVLGVCLQDVYDGNRGLRTELGSEGVDVVYQLPEWGSGNRTRKHHQGKPFLLELAQGKRLPLKSQQGDGRNSISFLQVSIPRSVVAVIEWYGT